VLVSTSECLFLSGNPRAFIVSPSELKSKPHAGTPIPGSRHCERFGNIIFPQKLNSLGFANQLQPTEELSGDNSKTFGSETAGIAVVSLPAEQRIPL